MEKRELLGIPLASVLLLTAFYLLIRLPLLASLPFVQDEGVYAVMIEEQRDAPSLVPTFLGHPISWKMAPFFWVYSFLTSFTGWAGLEASYRLPSLVFGFLSIFPLYHLIRHYCDGNRALLSCLLFLSSFASVYPNTTLLIDSSAFLLILLSLYFYLIKEDPIKGGAIAAIAFTFKLVTAFISPVLAALALILAGKKESILDKRFLISAALPILAAIINYTILSPFGGGGQVYFEELLPRIMASGSGSLDPMAKLFASFDTLGYSMGPIFIVSLFGLFKHHRTHPLLAGWYALIILPFVAGASYPWYYLPVLPAVCAFAAMALFDPAKDWKGNFDRLSIAALVIIASLYMVSNAYALLGAAHSPEKGAGLAIAGKENVLIIGQFNPGIFAYKEVSERRALGTALDYGLIIGPPSFGGEEAADFVIDYHTIAHPVEDGSFSALYTSASVFRKDTDISRFDYLVLSGDLGFLLQAPVIYQADDIIVYNISER
ncbi:MAG: glycosyltransferase family 39 protein [Candidatus Micrarchaeota archaeon]